MKNFIKYVGMYTLLLVLPFLFLGLLGGFIQEPGDLRELIHTKLFFIAYIMYAAVMLLIVLIEWNIRRQN